MIKGLVSGVLAAALAAPAALGQQASESDQGLDVIIVTARKVEENIRDVPIAITAFTAEDLARRNIEGLGDIARYTAGFSFENFAGGVTPAPIIRGLTQNTLTDRNQNVATFVDGIHVQQQGNIDFSLLDVERIEVLKGPQNSQYGRSAFAGAINYVGRKPVLGEWEGSAAATVGTDERLEYRAGVSIPLVSDKLAVRLYGVKSEFDGTWENRFAAGDRAIATTDRSYRRSYDGTDGNVGGHDNEALQGQVRFRPIDGLTFDLGYYRSEIRNEQAAVQFVRPGSASVWGLTYQTNCSPNATGTSTLYCGELDVDPDTVIVDPRSVGLVANTDLMNARVGWDISDTLGLTYQYGRGLLDQNSFGQSTIPPNPDRESCNPFVAVPCAPGQAGSLLFQVGPVDQEATSHEFRVDGRLFDSRVSWRLGYYTSKVEDTAFANSIEARRSIAADPTGQIVTLAVPVPGSRFRDESDAVFGSLSYTFADTWTVDVEGRYAEETRDQLTDTLPEAQFTEFTPRVNLKVELTPDWMLYASVAEGAKSGGFNTRTADPGFETFDPETNITYELGGKQVLLDGSLQLNYAVFYIDWTDLQISTADLVPFNPASPAADPNYIANVSGAESIGVELEALALWGDHWRVNFAGSYAEPTFDDGTIELSLGRFCVSAQPVCPTVSIPRPPLPPAVGSPIGGNQLPRTPRLKLAVGAEYRNAVGDWEYAARADLSHQDKQYAEVLNLAHLPARTLLDVNFTLTSPSADWNLSLWGKNVTDEEYASNAFVIGFSSTYIPSLAPGAMWGATVRYNFSSGE